MHVLQSRRRHYHAASLAYKGMHQEIRTLCDVLQHHLHAGFAGSYQTQRGILHDKGTAHQHHYRQTEHPHGRSTGRLWQVEQHQVAGEEGMGGPRCVSCLISCLFLLLLWLLMQPLAVCAWEALGTLLGTLVTCWQGSNLPRQAHHTNMHKRMTISGRLVDLCCLAVQQQRPVSADTTPDVVAIAASNSAAAAVIAVADGPGGLLAVQQPAALVGILIASALLKKACW